MDLATRRLTIAVLASTLLLSACAAKASVTPLTSSAVGYSLYYIDAQSLADQINVVDAENGRHERTLPIGTPSPDWSRLFAVSYDSSRTILRAVDTKTAAVIHQVSVDGSFALPVATAIGPTGGLSPNGDWLVLEGQVIRNQTDFVLINTSFTQHPRRISLTGSFSFDAISNDGQRLYLIESLAAAQPGHYRVRLYDLAAGSLDPRVIIDKRESETGSMTGTRISGIFSPDGAWQYSLYVNESKGAFIHALNLDSTIAWCIDLPVPQADQYLQTMWSLAIKPDGGALFVVNPDLASAARIDIGPYGPAADVSQVTSLKLVSAAPATPGFFTDALAKEIQMGSAAISRDGRTLFATTFDETVAINLATPTSQRRILDGAGVESVVMGQDGAWLFASSWDGPSVLRISPTTGTAVTILKTDTAWMLVRAEPR